MLIHAELSKNTTTSARKIMTTLCVYGFLLYGAAVLLYPVIFTREASFCIKQDNLHQTYPFFNKLAIALHKGYLPVWDANTYGGKNFSGEIQTGIFYPVNILWCLLFGTVNGIDVYYIDLLTSLHFLICLIGMYKLARTFQLPAVPAIAAALVFTFTGAVGARAGGQTGIFFGLTLLPWSVYLAARYYMVTRYKRYLLLSGLIAGMEILSGHMQPFFHTMIINAALVFFYEWKSRRNISSFMLACSINLLLVMLVVFVITLPQMYYAVQYLSQCYRSVGQGELIGSGEKVPLWIYTHRFIINLYNLPNLLGQGYSPPEDDNIIYMGVLPLLLLVTYLAGHKFLQVSAAHKDITGFLMILLLIGLLSSLGYLTFFPLILRELPFVPVVRQLGRYIILTSFCSSLFVGLALTYISRIKELIFQRHASLKQYVLLALACNALYWLFAREPSVPAAVSIPFLLTFLFFGFLRNIRKATDIVMLAVTIILLDLYLNQVSYSSTRTEFFANTFYARNRIIDTLERSYGKYRVAFDMDNYAYERRNLGNVYNIQTSFGYSATYNKSYLDFFNLDRRPNSEIGDLLNIRYVITDKTLDSNFIFKDSIQGIRLYEKRNYYPRIYWKSQLGMSGIAIEAENKGTITQTEYSDLYQRIEVNCTAHDTLVISENSYPGWKCYDNGLETTIRPAVIKHYPPLFRSIVLEKGHHIVEFRYNKVFHWF